MTSKRPKSKKRKPTRKPRLHLLNEQRFQQSVCQRLNDLFQTNNFEPDLNDPNHILTQDSFRFALSCFIEPITDRVAVPEFLSGGHYLHEWLRHAEALQHAAGKPLMMVVYLHGKLPQTVVFVMHNALLPTGRLNAVVQKRFAVFDFDDFFRQPREAFFKKSKPI